MADTFEDFVAEERERLNTEREAIFSQQHELQGKLDALNNEVRAIEAYTAAKSGKAPKLQASRMSSVRGKRSGSKRADLLRIISEHPDGLKRRDILEKLKVRGDKTGEMSISNALNALKKANQIASRDGLYLPA